MRKTNITFSNVASRLTHTRIHAHAHIGGRLAVEKTNRKGEKISRMSKLQRERKTNIT